jgi:orotate phosphoribosyltransferase
MVSLPNNTTSAFATLLDSPNEVLAQRLLTAIRRSGVKFRSREAFARLGWRSSPEPVITRFWTRRGTGVELSTDAMLWDLRAPLLEDDALFCCAVLLWRRSRKYNVRWIGGLETAAIPLVAAILAVNRALGAPTLNGFYLRKNRKPNGLRRLLEGVPPPPGTRILLIDDILNRGVSKKKLFAYCVRNQLTPAALLVVVDTEREGKRLCEVACPVESIFTRRVVLDREKVSQSRICPQDNSPRSATSIHIVSRASPTPPQSSSNEEMAAEDIELVRLARDTVTFTALSGTAIRPTLLQDGRGSFGYFPFLGRYLRDRAPVFTRISKREFRDGIWFNRLRGCQAVGLFGTVRDTIAEMTVRSAIVSSTRARRIFAGPSRFHKAVWPAEIGDLSLFVYVVEGLFPTKARNAQQLISEGHDTRRWGLVAECQGYRGVLCGGLDSITDVARQVDAVCQKMQNKREILPHRPNQVSFSRMEGRWLWDPARPKNLYF